MSNIGEIVLNYNFFECPVCREVFDDTCKMLPCQHTFHKRCLQKILSVEGRLECPQCGQLVSEDIELLPRNYFLLSVLDKAKSKPSESGPSSDNKRPLNCSVGTSGTISFTDSPPSVPNEKRVKANLICPSHKTLGTSNKTLQEIINKWQLSNFTKCIYDNAVNAVLETSDDYDNDFMVRENIIARSASVPHDFTLENEAVLMAIERKGLRQQDSQDYSANDISDLRNRSFSSQINCFYSSADDHPDTHGHEVKSHHYLVNSDDNPESNFENNFMTTAVSVAIEEKGLSMYHV